MQSSLYTHMYMTPENVHHLCIYISIHLYINSNKSIQLYIYSNIYIYIYNYIYIFNSYKSIQLNI